jgi:hypothetical protein
MPNGDRPTPGQNAPHVLGVAIKVIVGELHQSKTNIGVKPQRLWLWL